MVSDLIKNLSSTGVPPRLEIDSDREDETRMKRRGETELLGGAE